MPSSALKMSFLVMVCGLQGAIARHDSSDVDTCSMATDQACFLQNSMSHATTLHGQKANTMSAHGMIAYPTLAPVDISRKQKPCGSEAEEYMSPPLAGNAPEGIRIIDTKAAANVWECLETCMHSFHAEGGNGQCAGTLFNNSAQDLGLKSCTRYYGYYEEDQQTSSFVDTLSIKGCVRPVSSNELWVAEEGKRCTPCWHGTRESTCFIVESPEGCQALAESYNHKFYQYQETADDPDHPGGKCATMNECSEPKSNTAWSIYTKSQ